MTRPSTATKESFLARFARQQGGATAVEFAMVAAPFLALLFGIMELGLVFLGSVALDNATQAAARKVRTGELVSPGTAAAKEISRQAFRDAICEGMGFQEANCKAKLLVDVRTYTAFNGITIPTPATDVNFKNQMTFDTGGAGSIVLVRAYYPWTLVAPLFTSLEKVKGSGETLLTSVTTFRNEPFSP
jgi:Flp pilus assembly protein TadG